MEFFFLNHFVAALLGGIFSGPLGNLALLAIGIGIQLVVAWLFPQKIKGPRAETLKVQTAKYGDQIARVYGTARVAGAVIWLKDDHVDEHKKTEGGKGGPEVTEFTYTADFAVAFAWNGPFQAIKRIWADDKLVYDKSPLNLFGGALGGATISPKGSTIKIYLGTQDQEPDPDIEADRGVDMVPAWPGLVYVVWRNFPLDDFGIRLPNMEAELVEVGTPESTDINPTGSHVDWDTLGDYIVSTGFNDTELDINTFPTLEHKIVTLPTGINDCYLTARGDVACPQAIKGVMYFVDPVAGAITQALTYVPITTVENDPFYILADYFNDGATFLILIDGRGGVKGFTTLDGMWADAAGVSTSGWSLANPIEAASMGPHFIYMLKDILGGDNQVVTLGWSGSVTPGIGVAMGFDPTAVAHTSLPILGIPKSIHYDRETDSVVIFTQQGIYVFDETLTTLLNSRVGDFFSNQSLADETNSARMNSAPGKIRVFDNNGDLWEYNLPDLSLSEHIVFADTDWDSTILDIHSLANNDKWQAVLYRGSGGKTVAFLPRIGSDLIPLSSIISAECDYVELPYDVSDITPLVHGYVVREAMPPRGIIEDLQRVKFFDFAQVDGITRFFMRTNVSTRYIRLNQTGVSDNSKDSEPRFVHEEYSDLKELPQRVVLNYPTIESDFRRGSQSIARPDGLDETKSTMQFDTNLVMEDDEAAQSADIMFNETREVANLFKVPTSIKWMELHPGDVVELDLDELRTITTVLTKMEGEALLELELKRRTSSYVSDALGQPSPEPTPDPIIDIARTGFIAIDSHLFRSVDNSDAFYTGVYAAELGRFRSATVYRSTNGGGTFGPWMSFPTAALRGIALEVLPDVPHPEAWDRGTEFTFAVGNRSGVPNLPSSVTDEELLADLNLNAFAVASLTDWEVIRAATVVDNGDGTWTLSNLLRGRAGTEFATRDHAQGDIVVYLDPEALDRPLEGDRTLSRIYASIATGTVFTAQYAVEFTNQGRGLRPWSPTDIEGIRDGSNNLTINWKRRDRLGQQWPNSGAEDPPMSESLESYRVYIYDAASPADVLRTISASAETASYSAAEQTTDFGSPQASIHVGIVQVSSTFGNGIEGNEVI